jgi:tRNA threonylcarbamoyladenosine biosynthesis protein TsaB
MGMAEHSRPWLVIDASAPVIHVGVLRGAEWLSLRRHEGDALETLFALTSEALTRARTRLDDVGGFIFCEGPGGLLGLRLAAMAVETWRRLPVHAGKPLLAYRSLPVAQALAEAASGDSVTVVSPFRRGSFCVLRTGAPEMEVLDAAGVAALQPPVLFLSQRFLRAAPEGTEPCAYDLTGLPTLLDAWPELFREASHAEAWVPEVTEYKMWSGERHR